MFSFSSMLPAVFLPVGLKRHYPSTVFQRVEAKHVYIPRFRLNRRIIGTKVPVGHFRSLALLCGRAQSIRERRLLVRSHMNASRNFRPRKNCSVVHSC